MRLFHDEFASIEFVICRNAVLVHVVFDGLDHDVAILSWHFFVVCGA